MRFYILLIDIISCRRLVKAQSTPFRAELADQVYKTPLMEAYVAIINFPLTTNIYQLFTPRSS